MYQKFNKNAHTWIHVLILVLQHAHTKLPMPLILVFSYLQVLHLKFENKMWLTS